MNKLVLLFVALIAVIALFAYMSTTKLSGLFTVSHSSSQKISPTPKIFATKIIPLTIEHGKVVNNKNIQVAKGQMVVLQIRSDSDDTLEVLGYDKDVFLHKGQLVVLSFLSNVSGEFTYELQHAKAVLGTISVGK